MLRLDLNLLWTLINLIVLYLFLNHFLIGPVLAIMEKRRNTIDNSLAEAQDKEQQADKLMKDYKETLSHATEDADAIRSRGKKDAQAEYDRMIQEANVEAAQIKNQAAESILLDKEKTKKELEREIASLAIEAAEKMVGAGKGAEFDRAVYDQFLTNAGDENDTTIN